MFRQAKTNASKFLAGFLAVVMILSIVPVGIVFHVFAAEVESFTVKLPVSATVTLTDEADAQKVFTADTDENFETVFENLNDAATYTLVVSGMERYKTYTKTGVVADETTPLTISAADFSEKEAQTIAFADASITKTFGDDAFTVALSNVGLGTGAKTYLSTNEAVAEISVDGVVTIVGAGETDIKVSIAADDNYKAAYDTLELTVKQAENAVFYEVTSVNWVVGDEKRNALTTKGGAGGSVTYESDAPTVAQVDKTTGKVTILQAGTAKITATFTAGEGSNYQDSTASYTIVADKKANALSFESTEIRKTYGAGKWNNDTLRPADRTGTVTYTSDNPAVATVDSATGEYTIVGAGTAKITATLADDDNRYAPASAEYTLIVAKKENALSFDSGTQAYTYGDTVVANNLTVALKELGGFTGPVTYESSAPDVISVDSATGAITIWKSGEATVTASIAEEKNYAAATASYTVTVAKKTVVFEINETINYGDHDPDLAEQIKAGVIAGLADAEKDNTDIIDRVTGRISYAYPTVPDGELRPVGNYDITFTTAEDDGYAFDVSGSLEVENDFRADGLYQIIGLNEDNWGSETGTVILRVTDADKYRISETANHSGGWDKTELVFDTAEEVTEHTFYIRDIQTEGKQKVSLPAKERFGIDGSNPTVTHFDFKVKGTSVLDKVLHYLTFGAFFNEKVEVTVTASDAHSGVDTITLFYNDVKYGEPKTAGDNNAATFTLTVEEFKTLKTVSARATDKVGNMSEMTYMTSGNSDFNQAGHGMIQLEQIKPEIEVEYESATSVDALGNKWYGDDLSFAVTVSDAGAENSGIRAVWATINGTAVDIADFTDAVGAVITPYSNDTAGVVSGKEAYYFMNKKTETVHFSVNTNLVALPADGRYAVGIWAVDNAGNQVKYDEELVVNIDRAAPVITGFGFDAVDFVEGSETESTVEVTDYGFYFKADTVVTILAKDSAPSAGVKSITYYTVDKDTGKSAENTVDVNGDGQIELSIKANFKGQIYAKATDYVGHVADRFVNPNSTIVEDETRHEEETHILFTKEDTTFTANDGTELYANDVPVKLTVMDTYSGIRSIEWSVVAPYDTANNQSGQITVNNDKTFSPDSENGWTVVGEEANLVTKMEKDIVVKNNSNNIIVTVKMVDRAGNTSAETIEFSIDKTIPTIGVVYDNNTPDGEYTDTYNANRVATITVTERNFRAENVVFAITNTDGVVPAVDLTAAAAWKSVANEDPDKIAHVATVEYTVDGDYTFDIAYKDNAENAADTFAQHKFTLDKTIPTVTVVYDNHSALNGNYYKADRIATITIAEHNFDAARVHVIGTATDSATGEAVATTFPALGEWKDNGDDTHTATIAYTADARYTFDIEFLDKAGNRAEDYTPDEFTVDKTAPTLDIIGVADKSANNGEVAPMITFRDTNFNKNSVTITLSGSHNGTVDYTGAFDDVTNGQTYTYANFETVQSVDDIYTLTARVVDMAGNETAKTITFSVNRFGSVYDLATVKNLMGKYLQSGEDIVFTETNIDAIDREGVKITLTKNGTPVDLVEGTDYTVEVSGGDGQWSVYTYTVSRKLFADDGRYSLSIYSKDAAGNVNENIDETKGAEISFGIDKTKPVIVPIDFESGIQYAVERKTVSVEIKDNLVLEGVKIYLNGEGIAYQVDGETYTFDILQSNSKQAVRIVATDAAGNEFEVAVDGFLVNANLFVRWYNNTPLFVGSLIGVVVLALALTAVLLFGKKKKDEEK